ncbi:MAG: adenylosuccinate synthetase [Mycoplasmatales bacterium]|nr:adenylosuccinate synthetase [Mycoplasmatales bacterium]
MYRKWNIPICYFIISNGSSIPLSTGISTKQINEGIGIVKSYTTRVGTGAFPSEIKNEEISDYIRSQYDHSRGFINQCIHITLLNRRKGISMKFLHILVNSFTSFANGDLKFIVRN